MNVVETLQKAKTLLKEGGWTQGTILGSYTGRMCLLGAVGVATVGKAEVEHRRDNLKENVYDIFKDPELALFAVEALASEIDTTERYTVPAYELVYQFNDSACSEDEVYDLLDRAIEAAA